VFRTLDKVGHGPYARCGSWIDQGYFWRVAVVNGDGIPEYPLDAGHEFFNRGVGVDPARSDALEAEGAVTGEHRREQIPTFGVDISKVPRLELPYLLYRQESIYPTEFRQRISLPFPSLPFPFAPVLPWSPRFEPLTGREATVWSGLARPTLPPRGRSPSPFELTGVPAIAQGGRKAGTVSRRRPG
jgi:hypothetical protein